MKHTALRMIDRACEPVWRSAVRLLPVVAALSLAMPAVAQLRQLPIDPDSRFSKEASAVYVRDSGVASEKLALADRMERAAQWDKSADVYQEIVEKFADRVVPTHTDSAGQPTQYTSVAMVVQEKIAKWPAAGLAAYRRRFDDVARDQFAAAGDDSAALQKVLSLYFPTDAGKAAGLKLLAASFEHGEFAMAAYIGRRLLTLHPSLADQRPAVLFESALAEHLGGNDAAAQTHLDDLKTNFPAALGTVRGVEVKLADSLAAELAGQPAMERTFREGNWPMAFGAPGADAVPADVSRGGARLFTTELAPPLGRAALNKQFKNYWSSPATVADRNIGLMTGVMPAVDNGELFFQDNARVYAISLATGMPLPGWAATYAGDKHGQYSTEAIPTPRGQQLSVSVTADSVYAVLGQADFTAQAIVGMSQSPQVVCLDRQSGKRKWSTALDRLKLPAADAALNQGIFYGTPVVVGDSIYLMVRTTRGNQFDECHVMALRAADGAYQWSAYVASTSLGNRFAQIDDGSANALGATGQLSYADGRLYVLTNLGALACLDASDGKTLWLDIYPRSTDQPDRAGNRFIGQSAGITKPFTIDPPIVHGSQVFVMPGDSPSVLVYDAASGDLVATVPRALIAPPAHDPAFEPADMMLAVVGPTLVLGNRGDIFTVPWQKYDPAQSLVANGGKFRRFTSDGDNADDGIRGRPFVSGKFVLVPTGDKLYRMSLDQLKFQSIYPAQGRWDDEESAGNVVATADNIIVAGPTRVTAYADLGVATAKLDEQLKTSPGDVEIHLRYAGLLFAAGRPQDGVAKLDAAIAKLGGPANLRPGAARDHLFDIALGFAVKLQKVDGTPPKLATELFDRAWIAADAPEQQVRVRFALATLDHQTAEWAGELAMYQQVLAVADWRRVPINGADGTYTAAAQAQTAINQIIKDSGEAIYSPYEKAAAQRLTALKQAGHPDADQLLAIADEFPVSKQTLDALSMAADSYEAMHAPRQATGTLRRLLHCGLSNERRLVVLQALARNYLAVPRQIDTAIVRLRQAKTIAADAKLERPLTMPDGKTVADHTIAQALDLATAYRDRAALKLLPTLGVSPAGDDDARPPLAPAKHLLAATAIVSQQDDLARADRVVVLGADDQIHVFDSRPADEIFSSIKCAQPPIGCAYSGDTLVVVTPANAFAADAAGKVLWDVSLTSVPAIDAVAVAAGQAANDNKDAVDIPLPPPRPRGLNGVRINGRLVARNIVLPPVDVNGAMTPDGPERISNFRVLSDRLLIGTTAGRLASIGLTDGKIDWQARPLDRPIRHFLSNDDFLAVSYGDTDGSNTVCVLDALTGQTASRDVYDGSQPAQQLLNLALSPDGVLLTMTPALLVGRDLYEPAAPSWRHVGGTINQPDAPYSRSSGAGQFVVTAGRVLVVYFSNGQQQSVRAYDLRTLNPMKVQDARGNGVEASYSPRAGGNRQAANAFNNGNVGGMNDQTPVSIETAGPAFYLVGAESLAAYNLDNKDWQWTSPGEHGLTRDFTVCQDYAVQLIQQANNTADADVLSAIKMSLFSRAVVGSGRESGVLESRTDITDPDKLIAGQWQVADGAFYYVSAAHKLKVMKAE